MKINNRVRRNICFILLMVGVACIIARAWEVAMTPASRKAWFELSSIIILTYFCFDRFRILQKRVGKGIIYGAR